MEGSCCGKQGKNFGDHTRCSCRNCRSSCGCGGGGCGLSRFCNESNQSKPPQSPHNSTAISCSEIDEDSEPNMEDYLMNMTSLSATSEGKRLGITYNIKLDNAKVTSQPVVETVEREISPDIKQYSTKIVEEDPCSGKRAVMHVSHVLNKKTGTVITVQRTDYTGGCPLKDKNLLSYGESSSLSKRQ